MKWQSALLASGIVVAAGIASAQEFRGTLSGRVTDGSGALVPDAVITVTNTGTKVSVTTKSDNSGVYTTPFLLPGKYSITVVSPGFKKYEHSNLELLTSQKLQEDVQMTLGGSEESVVVTTEAPQVDTASSTVGQVLTAAEIADLPSNGRSAIGLAKTETGVVPKGKNSVVQQRPFDNSAASDFSLGGGNSQSNEVLLNGVPNGGDASRVSGYSPNYDAVDSVRTDVFPGDASFGDTSGGVVALTTKAGTNAFHGTASEFNQFSAINAPNRWFVPAGTKTPATRQNQYGLTIGGPVWIPKVFNGRDRLFFFYAYERFVDSTPNPVTTTVPTLAERNGDFSALLALGSSYQLYDPATAKQTGTAITRSPFAGNIINPARFNSVAKAYLQFYPSPNLAGGPDGQNNFFSNVPTRNDYNSHSGRLDFSFDMNNKLFFETHRSEYQRTLSNIFNNLSTGTATYTVYQGGVLDYIHTFNATTTVDVRGSLTRTYSNSTLTSQGFDPTTLGFPSYIDSNATALFLPRLTFSETSGTVPYAGLSGTPGTLSTFNNYVLYANLNKVLGHHSLKIGPDMRLEKAAKFSPGSTVGSYTFGTNFVQGGNGTVAAPFGGSFASFLLGLPTAGTQNIATGNLYNAFYYAGFVQDDWRARPSLTINMGVRLEAESSITESGNRAVVGWDPTLTNSATSGALAAYTNVYAGGKIPELPVANFNPRGGIIFASDARRSEYGVAPLYISPRVGFSFAPAALHGKTAIRGAFGVFVNPFHSYNTPQTYGFSSTTPLVPTTNNYLTPAATLSDPFPTSLNPIQQPTGSALGVNQNLGSSIVFRGPQLKVPYSERISLNVQQQLSRNLVMEIGYIGNHQVHLSYSNSTSSVPTLPFLSRSNRLDPTVQTNLSQSITNPFRGLPNETGTLGTSSTIAKLALLQAYPQYSSVTQQLVPGGSAIYNMLYTRLALRPSHGLTFSANYEYSRNLITTQLNAGGPLTYGESTSDYPHHFSFTGSYQLPFGRGQAFGGRSHVVDAIIGGIKVNTIYQMLSGTPLQWSNVDFANGSAAYNSDFQRSPRNITRAFNVDTFYRGTGTGYKNCTAKTGVCDATDTGQPNSYNYRTFPQYFFRGDFTNNLDASLIKGFHLGERVTMEYRFEAFNVLNHTQFGQPNLSPTAAVGFTGAAPSGFGTINSVASVPRVLQQGLRVVF